MAASDLKDKRDGHLAIRDWKNGKRQRGGMSDPGVWCSLSGESSLQCAVLSNDLTHHPDLADNTRHPNRRERQRLSRHIYFYFPFSSKCCITAGLYISFCSTPQLTFVVGLLARLLQLLTRPLRTGAKYPRNHLSERRTRSHSHNYYINAPNKDT